MLRSRLGRVGPVGDVVGAATAAVNFAQAVDQARAGRISAADLRTQSVGPSASDALSNVLDVATDQPEQKDKVFNAATVVTTHGFCEQVLRSLGTAGDVDEDVDLVEDLDDLTVEVVEDFYVRKWGVPGADAPSIRSANPATVG